MKNDTTVLPFRQSETVVDALTELAREGARRMLAEALKAEADAFVASFAEERLADGRQRIVRHGFGPAVLTRAPDPNGDWCIGCAAAQGARAFGDL